MKISLHSSERGRWILPSVTLLFAAVMALPVQAVTLDSDVTGTAGGYSSGGGFTVGFTVGEAFVGVSLTPAVPMAQVAGFWSPGVGSILAAGDPPGAGPAVGLSLAIAPNPFVIATQIRFVLPSEASAYETRVRLYDSGGRLIRQIPLPSGAVGQQSLTWDGRDRTGRVTPGGIYHCRIDAGPFTEIRRLAHIY